MYKLTFADGKFLGPFKFRPRPLETLNKEKSCYPPPAHISQNTITLSHKAQNCEYSN